MPSERSDDPAVRRTTDPALVRSVVESRGGYPAHRPKTEGRGDRGLLQIGRHGREDDLTEISWDEFEEKGLEFVYPDDPSEDDRVDGRGAAGEIDEVGELRERPDG